MLIPVVLLATSEGFSVGSLLIGVLGVVSLVAAGAIVVFGKRTSIVAGQQSQAIEALEGRLTAVESENASLRTSRDADRALLAERDRRIASLQSQIETLQGVVTSREAIEDLARRLDGLPAAVAAFLARQ